MTPGSDSGLVRPDLVIWGARRGQVQTGTFPPQTWAPRWVLDLVSGGDSLGREYAQRCGARYVGGEVFEHDLALERQQFWSEGSTLLPALMGRQELGGK